MACQMGASSALPNPMRNANRSKDQDDIYPPIVSSPSTNATRSRYVSMINRSLRRSKRSANAPAGMPSRKTGRLVAVCIRATRRGEGVREVISQAVPTLCIQVPILEMIEAVQIERKTA